jgi:aminoglycoside phosphotransferase (APT) family kinase protein
VLPASPCRRSTLARWGASSPISRRVLHDLDPVAFLRAVTHEGLEPRTLTFDAYLAQLTERANRRGLDGLASGLEWLARRRPPRPEPRAVCHGDFHPYNILMAGGRVTGVLDWPNALVADPAFDVASTLVILKLVPDGARGALAAATLARERRAPAAGLGLSAPLPPTPRARSREARVL